MIEKILKTLKEEERKTRNAITENSSIKQYYQGVADGLKVAIEIVEKEEGHKKK
jgi:hypothetical protein